LRQQLGHAAHGGLAHLYMDIADMEDGEAVEARGQTGRDDAIVIELDLRRIVQAPPIKSGEHQDDPDERMRASRILEVEEVESLAEDLRLVILLDAEALACMEASERLVERSQHVVVVCSHGVQVSSGGARQLSRAKRMPKS
jgi:hypothetical protein